ncbi:hypothetical protein FX987_01557 [Vreelandella titanicae]|uniref:Uncharacterized protein n=1 Tax=Vreelandella titanicae TaxID=664683 RepID=A0AAP9NKD8_9GAMM|nr:hypothetical protein FX987_01557 [Halomonas titanicae]
MSVNSSQVALTFLLTKEAKHWDELNQNTPSLFSTIVR